MQMVALHEKYLHLLCWVFFFDFFEGSQGLFFEVPTDGDGGGDGDRDGGGNGDGDV